MRTDVACRTGVATRASSFGGATRKC